MKKIVFSLLMSVILGSAHAQTVVPVVWIFSNASTHAAMVREIINEANKIQDKYRFVFEHKPGAGGAVGVHYTAGLKKPAILAHTSAFFTRPYLVPQGAYDPERFIMLNVYCLNQRMAMISKKYRTLADLQKQQGITIGIVPGSITQIVASGYAKNMPNTKITYVGYRGTPEITTALMQGDLDVGVEFLGTAIQHENINILAITGNENHGSFQTFRAQGVDANEQVTPRYYLMISKDTDSALVREFSGIMTRAVNNADLTHRLCRQEFGEPTNVSAQDATNLFSQEHQFWRQLIKTLFP